MYFTHEPVLLPEVLRFLNPQPGEIVVDATVGGGGHAYALLERLQPGGFLLGLDRDAEAIRAASLKLKPFGTKVKLFQASFSLLPSILEQEGLKGVDGLLFDLGVSSYQLERVERGFTYQAEAPLDMRMDRRQDLTAAEIVNTWPEEELARILKEYGEERWASRIARFIVKARQRTPIRTTLQLVEIVKAAIPARFRRTGPHPARRTFQALRIAVNDELGELQRTLAKLDRLLNPGGRVVVISFHSLEDRIVKHAFKDFSGKLLEILTPKPVVPSLEEIKRNPRARSAKLRAAQRVLKDLVGE
ncbi:16S rRNA (cytosine1402-N4)-methyltransferase [Thermanaeromonas toyohensis ToBE]|uniref:Ribosomal RNA small subunit methyltransferase H n=1 Tax=Thermanaeromonas toyohensis ToBE TaxID=698762 RepID=A0A1W1VLU0_9FIRM|nr:16S rRNA (cytosine(1402)-N(4))-methyltransferase RsmH [Thermanaeromonas toyohensis]SMB94298.1 16S rRNA (cytosine1402-N4)-methyltransferase [Thermanaeromonas toyohensis ToBE]